ncbi:Glucosidase 2 subunit beta [Spathaspora sp. JA1]|nr:Glucosidase 2 subunit beta [Spathaspora sp. JA1]
MLRQIICGTLLVVATSSANSIVGVSPEDQHLYNPTIIDGIQYWHCLNDSSIRLTYDQINDNYCDCPDGSDEPGTNACPDTKFYCTNKGHFSNYIDGFKVNDGVCDYDYCCDGTDEIDGLCQNKCGEIHQQYIEYKEGVDKFMETALKNKEKYLQIAKGRKDQLISKQRKEQNQLSLLKKQWEGLQLELENNQLQAELEQEEPSVYQALSDKFNDLNQKLQVNKDSVNSNNNNIETLEQILRTLSNNYNPNFNDPAVKESINKFKQYISNKQQHVDKRDIFEETQNVVDKLQETAKSLTYGGEIVVPTLTNTIHYYFQLFTNTFLKSQQPKVSHFSNNELSGQIDQLEKQIKTLANKLKDTTTDLNTNAGPNDILRAYDTINKKIAGYHYRINLLNSIYQDDILIGRFKEYKDDKVYFDYGSRCWNGPQRSGDVEFVCGKGPDIVSVSEPQKCHYHFIIQGESWCNVLTEEEVRGNFKIDYDKL